MRSRRPRRHRCVGRRVRGGVSRLRRVDRRDPRRRRPHDAMTPAEHQARAERITRSLRKCHVADYEIVIEGAMLASTHWFNLGLHRLGWSAPTHDVVHAEFIAKGERLKLSLLVPDLLAARDTIEAARALFVRGSAPSGEDAA